MSRCVICPRGCEISDGEAGFCKARGNIKGEIVCLNYGKVTSIALDPIEKKPLYHFEPGSKILSVGSFGCNMRCGFCQNHSISMSGEQDFVFISPDKLANKAESHVSDGNIGVAYTYNEPLIGFEYVLDCSKSVRDKGLKNVVVTNGYIRREPLEKLLPYTDAMNIDLKGFTYEYYSRIKGELETVKNTIKTASDYCHVEVTTLIVPGENDTLEEITDIAKWIACVNKDIPLHISRFFPNYKYYDVPPTDIGKIYEFAESAREYLTYVYTGNC
jgi:pyruvate formate lyase activating enzyme